MKAIPKLSYTLLKIAKVNKNPNTKKAIISNNVKTYNFHKDKKSHLPTATFVYKKSSKVANKS